MLSCHHDGGNICQGVCDVNAVSFVRPDYVDVLFLKRCQNFKFIIRENRFWK